MYHLLYKYFALHKRLSIPGIGCFNIRWQPSETDYIQQQIMQPIPEIIFDPECNTTGDELLQFMLKEGASAGYPSADNIGTFFTDLRKKLDDGDELNLPNLGHLQNTAGGIRFEADIAVLNYFRPVPAKRIIREDAEHSILVGDDIRTNMQMLEHFEESAVAVKKPKKGYWWVFAIVLAVIGIAAIWYYYWQLQFVQQG